MEKVRPWCGQPSDRGRLRNRTEHLKVTSQHRMTEFYIAKTQTVIDVILRVTVLFISVH